ncbi:hypothetical protein C8Q79DRAFT_405922 [Trametes meyenii]|nr:hypothetical protein C8Q79DRAFT_405922 [Trametes meyenii]
MRRIAAVFASKRSDRSDAASSTAASSPPDHNALPTKPQLPAKPHARFFRSLSRKSKPVDPVVSRLSSSERHPPSSSSSSSGAPTTPDDDRGSLLRAHESKAWHPLPPLPHPLDHHSTSSFLHPDPAPHDRAAFHSLPRPRAAPSRQSTLDTEDESSDESSVAPDLSRPPERSIPLPAPAYLLQLTSSSLRPPFAPPPLLHVPGCPLYPRSCNPRRALPYADSLQSTLHRTRLQRRLEHGDLSPSENRSIASLAGRRSAPKARLSLQLDDNAVDDYRHIKPFSAGLRKWADRPCFEDRVRVLLAEDAPVGTGEEPAWTRVVPATDFGVAALEYSVGLELLAGLYEEDVPGVQEPRGSDPAPVSIDFPRLDSQLSLDLTFSLTPPPAPSPMGLSPSSPSPPEPQSAASSSSATAATPTAAAASSTASSSASHASSRNHQYKATPSPLRMEASSSPTSAQLVKSPVSSLTSTAVASPQPSVVSPTPSTAPLKSALKQGVRFVEGEKDDKDDSVPMGYVQRIKQKREEKARFLQAERERRKYEDERRRHEEEKRRWEEERAAWEREKRAIEEERKKRMYAEEIAAARSRRESQRFGALGAATGEGLATGQWDRSERPRAEREREREREGASTYTRPVYDAVHPHGPVRQGSDSSINLPRSRTGTGSGSGSGSPSESRPGSVYGAGHLPGSRPSSMYNGLPTPSSSQQDVRLRERRVSGSGSRRGSMISESGGSHRHPDPLTLPPMPPVWGTGMGVGMGMNMNMNMAAMPMQGMPMVPMPMYGVGMDMPLLPPSPPFMMQQYGYRPPSQNSHRHSQQHSASGSGSAPQRSHSSSPTMGRHSLPASGSTDRVNRLSQAHGSSSASASASARSPSVPRSESASASAPHRGHHRTGSGESAPRPSGGGRSVSYDRKSTRSTVTTGTGPGTRTGPQRPTPTHSSSLPPHPPPSFNPARQSWAAVPRSGFENVSRPQPANAQGGGRRQTFIS